MLSASKFTGGKSVVKYWYSHITLCFWTLLRAPEPSEDQDCVVGLGTLSRGQVFCVAWWTPGIWIASKIVEQ